METKKSKVFTKRLIALLLSVMMLFTCFSGVLTAYAKAGDSRWDTTIASQKNWVDWTAALSDQACEALLDRLDQFLMSGAVDLSGDPGKSKTGAVNEDGSIATISYKIKIGADDPGQLYIYISSLTGGTKTATGNLNSIDGILQFLYELDKNGIWNYKVLGIKAINTIAGSTIYNAFNGKFGPITGLSSSTSTSNKIGASKATRYFRKLNDARTIINAVLNFLNSILYNSTTSYNLLYQVLSGSLDVGMLSNFVDALKDDDSAIGGALKGLVGAPDGKWAVKGEKALYNGLAYFLVNKTDWFKDDTVTLSSGQPTKYNGATWVYDDVLMDKLSTQLLQNINIQITYPEMVKVDDKWQHDNSRLRYKNILAYIAEHEGATVATASAALGYDSKLEYTEDGNVYLFRYDGNVLSIAKTDTLYAFAMRAIKLAWKTALKPTVNLLQVNYSGHEQDGNGTNFDNVFFTWYATERDGADGTFDAAAAYTTDVINAFAEAKYEAYGAADAAEFLENVKNTYNYDRYAKNEYYNWRDLDVTTLWNQVRYSPLANALGVQSGPLNLYFLQTGCENLEAFMDADATYTKYASIPEALNDALVAAAKDLLPNAATIGMQTDAEGTFQHFDAPSFATTTAWSATTLLNNVRKALEYAANMTDANLVNPFYAAHGIAGYTADANNITSDELLEEALVPFGCAALKQWDLTAVIHDSDWDKVTDLESAAVIALNEYLGYIFPERDYTYLWEDFLEVSDVLGQNSKGEDVTYKLLKESKDGKDLYTTAILPMARDAAAYVCVAAGVPVAKKDTTPWDPYTDWAKTETTNTAFDLINATAVYFLGDTTLTFDPNGTKAPAKGIGTVLGLCSSSGVSSITIAKGLWANLDAIVNRVLPVAGELQKPYGTNSYLGNGKFSSQKFVEGEIIDDVRDFNLTSLVEGVYSICSAAPIKSDGVVVTVYDKVLRPTLNSLLGTHPAASSQELIANITNANRFDTFLKSANIISLNSNRGVIGTLLNNVVQLLTDADSYPRYHNVISFALSSLGVPRQFRQHDIGGVEIGIDSVISGTSASAQYSVTNASYGLNKFYHDASGTQKEASRYWVKITSLDLYQGTSKVATLQSNVSLSPEATNYYTLSRTLTANTLYRIVATYDVYYVDSVTGTTQPGTAIYTGLKDSTAFITTSTTVSKKSQMDMTFDGSGYKEVDSAETGSFATATGSNITIKASTLYTVNAADAKSDYFVRLTNGASSAVTVAGMYMTPAAGFTYKLRTTGNAGTALTAANSTNYIFVDIDEDGNIYSTDGTVVGNVLTSAWIYGYNKSTNDEGKEVFDNAIALKTNATLPSNVAAGTPFRSVTMESASGSIDAGDYKNVKIATKGTTKNGLATVRFTFKVGTTWTNLGSDVTFAAIGDMDALKAAVAGAQNLINTGELSATNTAFVNAATAASFKNAWANNVAYFANADTYREALEEAMESAATSRETITADVNATRDGLEEVDYKVASFKAMVAAGQKAEALRTAEPITVEGTDGNEYPVYDAKGRETYTYTTTAPQWQIDEYTRQYNKYKSYLIPRDHVLTRAQNEVIHATSPVDKYDEVQDVKNAYTAFTATPVTAERTYVVTDENGVPVLSGAVGDEYRATSTEKGDVSEYRFAYTTKDNNTADNVKVYKITTTATDVKFGKVVDGELKNEGDTVYTQESWDAYIDALGEVVTSINNNEEISKTYTATSHLVMAENELEPAEEEESSTTITVSGKVLIASDISGTATAYGLRGVVVYAVDGEGNVIAQTVSNAEGDKATWGDYTLEVPAGTTQLYVGSPDKDSIVNRGFTIAGDADVTGADVAVVMCDYNDDGVINSTDKGRFNDSLRGEYSIYADFNLDGVVNSTDKGRFNDLLRTGDKGVSYTELSF